MIKGMGNLSCICPGCKRTYLPPAFTDRLVFYVLYGIIPRDWMCRRCQARGCSKHIAVHDIWRCLH